MLVNSHTCRELKNCNILKTNTTNSFLDENCAVLDYYPASSGNFLPTFRDNPSVASSRVKNPKEILLSQCGVCIGKIVGSVKSQQRGVSQWG
jgi:hypothetical protein